MMSAFNRVLGFFAAGTWITVKNGGGRNVSHPTGIALSGRVVFQPDQKLPKLGLFRKGVEEEAVCVFANAGFAGKDDRAMAVRGCLFRLASPQDPTLSKFDLHTNTGYGIWKDFESFLALTSINDPTQPQQKQIADMKAHCLANPANYYKLCESFVRYPTSYSNLLFNSKFPLSLTADDGSQHYVKFRIVPIHDGPTELLSEEDQKDFWNLFLGKLEPGDTRTETYLAEELRARIASEGSVQMKLEMMSTEQRDATNLSFFHPDAAWGQSWLHLGTISLTAALGEHYLKAMRANVSSLPEGLAIIPAVSTKDPNWNNHVRPRVYEFSTTLRQILNSTSTLESQARQRGQPWKNLGREIYEEDTRNCDTVKCLVCKQSKKLFPSDAPAVAVMALKTGNDLVAWGPAPWTSDVPDGMRDADAQSMDEKVVVFVGSLLARPPVSCLTIFWIHPSLLPGAGHTPNRGAGDRRGRHEPWGRGSGYQVL